MPQNLLVTFLCAASLLSVDGFQPADQAVDDHAKVHQVNIFAEDGQNPLRKVRKSDFKGELDPVGRITVNQDIQFLSKNKLVTGRPVGTGFLVSPCLVMTAYHVVFGESKSPNAENFSVTFWPGEPVVGKPLAWGAYYSVPRNPENDWALVELPEGKCSGLKVGWLAPPEFAAWELAPKPNTIFTAGYPASEYFNTGPDEIWIHKFCSVRGTSEEITGFYNDCAIRGGQSGSPVMYRDASGGVRVIGMIQGDYNRTPKILKVWQHKYRNYALEYVSILIGGPIGLIREDLEKHGALYKTFREFLAKPNP